MRRWMCLVLLVGCGGPGGTDAGARDGGGLDAAASDAGMVTSDASATDAGATDAGTTDAGATDAGATDGGSPCPIEGSFVLDAIVCDGMDITAEFQRIVTSSTMTMTATPTGCEARVTNESASCRESATQRATVGSDGVWTFTSDGIDECTPSACAFGGMDAPCALGDRAGTWMELVVLTADTLSGTRTDGMGICAGFGLSPTEVRWRRGP